MSHMAHCNTLQHAATHCNTLQHAATRCNTLHRVNPSWAKESRHVTHGTLQHTATRCNTLHRVNPLQGKDLSYVEVCCSVWQCVTHRNGVMTCHHHYNVFILCPYNV